MKKVIFVLGLMLAISVTIPTTAKDIDLFDVYGTGSLETIKQVIENGADINAQDDRGSTPIIYAAQLNDDPAVITYLLDNGADPSIKNNAGYNALDNIKYNTHLINTDAYYKIVEKVTGEKVKPKDINIKAYRDIKFGDAKNNR